MGTNHSNRNMLLNSQYLDLRDHIFKIRITFYQTTLKLYDWVLHFQSHYAPYGHNPRQIHLFSQLL